MSYTNDLKLTVSIGISHGSYDIETLLEHADQALYTAKEMGRDIYVLYSEEQ